MTESILTHRPFEFAKGISYVNEISRIRTGSPFCHISIRKDGYIYESTAGKGVHKMDADLWMHDREGTTIFIYEMPEHYLDFGVFDFMEGKGYDYLANIQYALRRGKNLDKALSKNPNDKIYCSELWANMAHKNKPWEWTPHKCALDMAQKNLPLRMEIIK